MLNVVPYTNTAESSAQAGSARAIPILPGRRRPEVSMKPAHKHPSGKAGKIVLPTMEGMCFEKVKHIAYLEASGNYTVLHFLDGRQILVCKTLREVEGLLRAPAFVRIHRSHTIHLRHIKKYVRGKGGHVVLLNSVTLTVSAGQKDTFLNALKQYFN